MTSYSSAGVRCAQRGAQNLDALDPYVDRLWRVNLPLAASVDTTTLRLVWLTAGFSVTADRAAVGDYVCALQSPEITRRAHLSSSETRSALDSLVAGGLLEPLPCCADAGYRLRPERGREALSTA